MTITFDGGTEQPWITTMTGSRKATEIFNKCASYVRANAPTQPGAQSSGEPTQPTGKRVKDNGGV